MSSDGSGLKGLRVLVAEDAANVAACLEQTLRDFGCIVLGPVASIKAARRLLQDERPDVALLDVRLEDGWATPLVQVLAALGVPLALTTGCDDGRLDPPLRGLPRLAKPYGEGDLHRVLRRLHDGIAAGRGAECPAGGCAPEA